MISARRLPRGGLLDNRVTDLGWLLLFNSLIFQSSLKDRLPLIGYSDELAVLVLLASAIFRFVGKRWSISAHLHYLEKWGLGLLFLLVAVGLLGGYVSGVQSALLPIAVDIFACVKFPIAFVGAGIVLSDNDRLKELLTAEIKALLILMIPFAVANQFFDLSMSYDVRYGLKSFQFVFTHPGTFSFIMAGVSLVLIGKRDNRAWLLLSWLFIALSLRSTGIAFVAVSAILVLFSDRNGRIPPLRLALIGVLAGVAVLALGIDQFEGYYSMEGGARRELTLVAPEIANRYWPLGSGFATYASNITAQPGYYSDLYYQYGLSSVYGLEPGNIMFLSDTFWPIVIGQFGWLGLSIYLAMLACLCMGRVRSSLGKGFGLHAVLLLFCYLFVSTLGSSSFFHPAAIYLAMSAGIACAGERQGIDVEYRHQNWTPR